MSDMHTTIRLYVEHPLGAAQSVPVTAGPAQYLFAEMGLRSGGEVALFNGRDGEWRARVAEAGPRGGRLECVAQTAPQQGGPDLWLLFAQVPRSRTESIVEKAAEMGVARIMPVATEFGHDGQVLQGRLQRRAVDAVEKCGGTLVPELAGLQRLDSVLADWPAGRRLMFCDEALAGGSPALAGGLARAGSGSDPGYDPGCDPGRGPFSSAPKTASARLRGAGSPGCRSR